VAFPGDDYNADRNWYLLGFDGTKATWILAVEGPTRFDLAIRRVEDGVLSHDLKHWAYIRDGDLWICDADGTDAEQLTTEDTIEAEPSWSRTDDRIVFASRRTGCWQIHALDVKTRKTTQLTNGERDARQPAINSVGKRLAYVVAEGDGTSALVEHDLVAGETRTLAKGKRLDFAWAMFSSEKIAISSDGTVRLHDVVDDRDLRVFRLRDLDAGLAGHVAIDFDWRANACAVACRTSGAEGTSPDRIWILPLDERAEARSLAIPKRLAVPFVRWAHVRRWNPKGIW